MIKTILVPTDGSGHANRAVAFATEIAEKCEARLVLLHVMSSEPLTDELRHMAEAEHLTAGSAGASPANVPEARFPASMTPGSEDETYRVRSRWTAAGAGRADVRIGGPEVAAELAEQGLNNTEIELSECWDDAFLRVFFESRPTSAEDDGDAASCVLRDSLFADDDIDLL